MLNSNPKISYLPKSEGEPGVVDEEEVEEEEE